MKISKICKILFVLESSDISSFDKLRIYYKTSDKNKIIELFYPN